MLTDPHHPIPIPTGEGPEAAPETEPRELTLEVELDLPILRQPTDSTCGATCLHAVYGFYGDRVPLELVIEEVGELAAGGTLAVFLGCHALERGYRATLYSYNLRMFDPSWFHPGAPPLDDRLRRQAAVKTDDARIQMVTPAYLRFLELGGRVAFEDLTPNLLRRLLADGTPILTGLSATYLYHSPRSYGPEDVDDDVRGQSMGHFVVLAGYDQPSRRALIADPYPDNPVAGEHYYTVGLDRLVGAIFLGILTYDGNLLVIERG